MKKVRHRNGEIVYITRQTAEDSHYGGGSSLAALVLNRKYHEICRTEEIAGSLQIVLSEIPLAEIKSAAILRPGKMDPDEKALKEAVRSGDYKKFLLWEIKKAA